MIRIFTDNTQDKIEVTDALEKLIKDVAEGVLEFEEIDEKCEVNVMFADNEQIRGINREQRDIDVLASAALADDADGCQHHHDHRKHLKELHFTYAPFHASIASSQNLPSH